MASLDYPYRLRLFHEGYRSVRVERRGRRIRIDPVESVESDDIVLLTGGAPEQVTACVEALSAGQSPTVLGDSELLRWLGEFGRIDAQGVEANLDGLALRSRDYTPVPWVTPAEAPFKLASALTRPDRAVGRLLHRARAPRCAPRAFQVQFADGARLVHLGTALHRGTPTAWFENTVAEWGGAEWLIVGMDPGEQEAILDRIPRLGARRVLLTDLLSDVRRELGMPVKPLTPAGDQLLARGLDVTVFVGGAGMRYEHTSLGGA